MTWNTLFRGYKTIVDMGAPPNCATVVGPNHAANARLIAAAPDMLAALHEVLNLCDRDSEIGWVCVAAIEKAKGN